MPAPLRTIDWRFLLPAPAGWPLQRAVILGGPAGIVARAACGDIAAELLDQLPTAERVDLVAALIGTTDDLSAIAAALTDDGVLYLELPGESRTQDSLARTTKVIEAAGLTIAARYLVEPAHADARAYIPVGARYALEWHRRAERFDRPGMRLVRRARASAERLVPALAVRQRSYAIIASRTRRDASVPGVLCDRRVQSVVGPSIDAAVMQAYGGDRVILFPFAAGAREPVAVVKVPKTRALADRTVHEQVETRMIRAGLPADLGAAIPEPLGVVPVHDVPVTVERYVSGVRLTALTMAPGRSLDAKAADLALGIDWLIRFHRATETARVALREIATEWITRPQETFERTWPLGNEERRLLGRARATVQALGDRLVPVGRQHRDFAVWNLLVTAAGRLTVVDWEGTRHGPGVIDAVHLVTTWLYACRLGRGDDDEPRSARDVFAPTDADPEAEIARAALVTYAEAVGLERSLLPVAVLAHRLELALRRLEQGRLHSAGDAPVELPEVATVRLLARVAEPFSAVPVR